MFSLFGLLLMQNDTFMHIAYPLFDPIWYSQYMDDIIIMFLLSIVEVHSVTDHQTTPYLILHQYPLNWHSLTPLCLETLTEGWHKNATKPYESVSELLSVKFVSIYTWMI